MAKVRLRKTNEIADLREQVDRELTRLIRRKTTDLDDPYVLRLQTTVATLDWTLGAHDDPIFASVANVPLDDEYALTLKDASRPEPPKGVIGKLEALDWRIKAQLTIAFAALIIVPFWIYRDYLYDLGEWGYLGAFLVNGLSNATIVLPAPGSIIIALMAEQFDPYLIGIAAGIGGAIGGMTSYFAGAINTTPSNGRIARFMRWTMARGGIPVLFVFSAFPLLPGDIASIVAGSVRYPILKYLIVTGLGNIVKMTFIALVGLEGLEWLQQYATEVLRDNPFQR
jgi:membrane protein YqaA with SNARE-associated domain